MQSTVSLTNVTPLSDPFEAKGIGMDLSVQVQSFAGNVVVVEPLVAPKANDIPAALRYYAEYGTTYGVKPALPERWIRQLAICNDRLRSHAFRYAAVAFKVLVGAGCLATVYAMFNTTDDLRNLVLAVVGTIFAEIGAELFQMKHESLRGRAEAAKAKVVLKVSKFFRDIALLLISDFGLHTHGSLDAARPAVPQHRRNLRVPELVQWASQLVGQKHGEHDLVVLDPTHPKGNLGAIQRDLADIHIHDLDLDNAIDSMIQWRCCFRKHEPLYADVGQVRESNSIPRTDRFLCCLTPSAWYHNRKIRLQDELNMLRENRQDGVEDLIRPLHDAAEFILLISHRVLNLSLHNARLQSNSMYSEFVRHFPGGGTGTPKLRPRSLSSNNSAEDSRAGTPDKNRKQQMSELLLSPAADQSGAEAVSNPLASIVADTVLSRGRSRASSRALVSQLSPGHGFVVPSILTHIETTEPASAGPGTLELPADTDD